MNEMEKLSAGLNVRYIPYTLRDLYDGTQIVAQEWDAICHSFSYGGPAGLLEVMGLPQCEGDVIGWLTAEQVLAMVDEAYPPSPMVQAVIDYFEV